jgi:hypothetical protein
MPLTGALGSVAVILVVLPEQIGLLVGIVLLVIDGADGVPVHPQSKPKLISRASSLVEVVDDSLP